MRANPDLEIDARFSEYSTDVVAEGIDIALRIGRPIRGGLIVSKLARMRRVACAAPQYLTQHGNPQQPDALPDHVCLSYGRHGTDGWSFATGRGETTLHLPSVLRADAGEVLRAAAVDGLGIAYMPWFLVAADVAAGRLTVVLEPFETHINWIYAAYTEAVRRAPKVTAFIAFLRLEFERQPF